MLLLNVLFPKVRAELLRVLFADPAVELHLRELVRQSGLGLGTVQEELAKLEEAELIRARADGNRKLFRANTEHPVFADLHGLVTKTAGVSAVLADALSGLAGVDLAFVFGSWARGKAGADSDIDLMVIGKTGLRALAPRLRPAMARCGREINPHVLAPEEWTKRLRDGDAFVADVARQPKLFVKGGTDEFERMA
jgi:predicted nucleotidyltransferase